MSRRAFSLVAIPALIIGALVALPTSAVADGSLSGITVGTDPQHALIGPDPTLAYVTNKGDNTVSRVDLTSGTVTGTVAVGDNPINLALRPGTNEIWVANSGSGNITLIDAATFTVSTTFVAGAGGPFAVAFSTDGSTAYVVGYTGSTVSKINASTHAVVDSEYLDGAFPEYLTWDATGTRLYVSASNQDVVYELDPATLSVVDSIAVGDFPIGMAVAPDGTLWVANTGSGVADTVSVIDTSTNSVIDTIPTFPFPIYIARGWDDSMWVTSNDNTLGGAMKIDATTRDVLIPHVETGNGDGSTGIARVPGQKQLLVVNETDNSVARIGTDSDRLQGADRYATAVAISQAAFQTTTPVVYVATGTNYPDALAAGPAAAKLGGPVLLTQPGSLPAVTKTEIQRLAPSTIVVLGGTSAISTAVANELATITTVRRIQGSNRYETARNIVADAFTTAPTVYLATGQNFPDALGGGNAGASTGSPVVLVNGQASSVDSATLALLDDLGTTDIKILGGTSVVSNAIQSQLGTLGFTVTRLSGADRYATSLAINQDAFTASSYALLATATNFPDALAGSAIGGKVDAPLYVVPKDCVPAAVLDEFDRLEVSFVVLLGGPAALTVAVEDLTSCS